jgi:hypothetical protein
MQIEGFSPSELFQIDCVLDGGVACPSPKSRPMNVISARMTMMGAGLALGYTRQRRIRINFN